ncbi:MAG: hypothetical protein A2940_02335 [Candidatus Wildermuthbacteria bacterium RIFCSPLOWO2_01_FULL_48_29]|uniref:DUF5667 domain-containing protein n=2 Tax=Candidatus Wildermuthiibacteriota TaxID=1817923 RepID=A0A1G2RNC8_9BACT|nr:MAG: hypothetical protein A2843_02050 [Candidatus Wildermuthbacteria bacterium RIFCSPHIGHO2_01_FULL_48_27b]OHA73521.1 MAG: hypothetical protein A2940_02335 [Candidatus Wildermuthbacteria bacterium RIFCSPLOWO2_01_FULL_48_29]
MEDKELITKLSYLKQIQPKEEWVFLTRQRLLGREAQRELFPLQNKHFWGMVEGIGRLVEFMVRSAQRPAFVIPVLAFLVAGGAVGRAAFESLPGDTLYPLKVVVEQIPLRLAGEEQRPAREFALAQQRLSDLRIVAEQNKIKNLPLAIQEFEANASKISEGFVQIVENEPSRALQASRQIVQLQKEKSEVEKILGTKIGEGQEEEIQDATRRLVEYELGYLETRSLTEEQKELAEQAKAATEQRDYAGALEYIWTLSQINEEG